MSELIIKESIGNYCIDDADNVYSVKVGILGDTFELLGKTKFGLASFIKGKGVIKTLKVHFYDVRAEMNMPTTMLDEYKSRKLRGSLCGYIRKVTSKKENVNCKICLGLINKLDKQA